MRNFWNTPQKSSEGLTQISAEFFSDGDFIYHLVNGLYFPITTADDYKFINKITEVEELLNDEEDEQEFVNWLNSEDDFNEFMEKKEK